MTAGGGGRSRFAVLSCALLLAGALAGPVAAQPAPDPGPLSLEVLALDGVLAPDRPLRAHVQVRNDGRADREDVRIVATVHRELIGRWQLRQAVEEGEVGNIVHPFVADLDAIPARGSRSVELVQSAEEVGLARDSAAGVYPLRLQLLDGGEVVDEVITAVMAVPEDVEAPLDVSLLVPLALPPARDAEGVVVDDAVLSAVAEGGLLSTTAATMAAHPRLTAVLALDGQTLNDVSALTDGFARREEGVVEVRGASSPTAERARVVLDDLVTAAGRSRVQTLALPYATADLVALVRNDLGDEASRHITDGARAVEWVTGSAPVDDVLWPPDGLDGATLAMARRSGVEALVAHHAWLADGEAGDLSPAPVQQVAAEGGRIPAFVPDPYLERALGQASQDGAVLDAQRVLAELASVYFELPGTPGRGVVVAPPPGTPLPAGVLEALAGPLSEAPFLRTATLSQLERRVDDERPVKRLAYDPEARRAELPPAYTATLATARRALGSLGGVLEADEALPARFDRLLLQAASVHYRGGSLERGRDLLAAVTRTVEQLYQSVEVLDSPPVTLTAVQGELPVTVRSEADVPLRVRIGLRTPRYEVEGGPVREVQLAPNSTEIFTFAVRSLAPGGTSPVQVLISDRDGVMELASGTVVVRSSAFSVVGLVVTVGAALFLLLWWLRQAARRRQPPPRAGAPRRPGSAPTTAERPATTVPEGRSGR